MAATDLTTAAAVQAYLGPTASAAAMAQLSQLVSAASGYIHRRCGVDNFNSASYTETYNGNGTQQLFLRNWPVTAVSSLQVDSMVIPQSAGYGSPGYLWDVSSIVIRPGGGGNIAYSFRSFPGNQYLFNPGVQNVVVSYTAGFNPVPADLAEACIEIAAESFARSQNVGKESIGTGVAGAHGNTNFTWGKLVIPLLCDAVIRNYERVWGVH